MIRFILHIGYPKTGTTSLQKFLCEHRSYLIKQHKILYPQTALDKASFSHFLIPASIQINRLDITHSLVQQMLREIDDTEAKTVVLSSEFLIYPNLLKPFLTVLNSSVKTFPINSLEIVVYLRRQDLFLESTYKQDVKEEEVHSPISSYNWIPMLLYYDRFLYQLKQLLDETIDKKIKTTIIPRPIPPRERFNTVADFIENVLQSVPSSEIKAKLNQYKENPSLSCESTLALRRFNQCFSFSPRNVLSDLLRNVDSKRKNILRYLYSTQQRIEILAKYEKSNIKFFKEWISSSNLFTLSLSEIDQFKLHDEFVKANHKKIEEEIELRYKILEKFAKNVTGAKMIPQKFTISKYGWNNFFGWIDYCGEKGISGWILDLSTQRPSTVVLTIEGYPVLKKTAHIIRRDVNQLYSQKQELITGFQIQWQEVILPKPMQIYLKSIRPDKVLDIRIIEDKSKKAIFGNYKPITAKMLLSISNSAIHIH